MRRTASIRDGLARALCVLALLFLGLAHQPPLQTSARAGADNALAYTLPDGTLADLCQPSGPEGKLKLPGKTCEACRIGAAMLPPPPAGDCLPLAFSVLLAGIVPPHAAPVKVARTDGQGPRAPPQRA